MESAPEKEIGKILTDKGLTLTVAESCTGGLVNSRLTDVSGSSAYIKQGFVVYSNEAKREYLGVSERTLKKYGAVSEQTVSEMLDGVLKNTKSDLALAISGIAGPKSDDTQKPVGLVFLGAADKNNKIIRKFQSEKLLERVEMKKLFADKALELLLEFIKDSKGY